MERITSFIAYWISVALAFFGAMTPQDFAAYFGALGVVFTVGVNWYYRRKSYQLLKTIGNPREAIHEITR
ncbi:prophage Hp1 family holin [Pectobacterium carotovorum subsp. carotovorum PC1]|uniref:Prophage Hp1 family holin n=2 Tax=Pectobacteriaceae TaxID=1903410 RepID=C6DCA6_PECCP|nr:prophage Hp1 family holin [Pectobacterium carotovorum subsp. carotovorum PC1]